MKVSIDKTRPYVRSFAPGRTELAGNHTDHQGGRVIAATIDCGITMMVQANGSDIARIDSSGFDSIEVDFARLQPEALQRFTTAALVGGIVSDMRSAGTEIGGFDAVVTSDLPSGGGLSSSAAFELALAQALNVLFAEGRFDEVTLARIGQAAERDWFGKSCGLMDQLSIALGGVNLMDFSAGGCSSTRLDFNFEQCGYALMIVDTHCDHSEYSDEYSQVARDMQMVAQHFGVEILSQLEKAEFLRRFEDVRSTLGDLPALRGLHYYLEMELVDARAAALRDGDIEEFLRAMRRSAASSAQYLQNVSTGSRSDQPAMVALALCDCLLAGKGAARIHGGGFGGTVQVLVPEAEAECFTNAMDAHLGVGSCRRYRVSSEGALACMMEGSLKV